MTTIRKSLPRDLDPEELCAVRRLCWVPLEFVREDVAERLVELGLVLKGQSTMEKDHLSYRMVIRRFLPWEPDWD